MLVQGLAFEKLVTTKTLTNKLIMHQDRAVGKSPAGLCRCFRDVAEKPKIAEMLTFARHDLEDKTGRKGGFGRSSRIMSLANCSGKMSPYGDVKLEGTKKGKWF